jgi:hypothetical protein
LRYMYNKEKGEVSTMSHTDQKGKTTHNPYHSHVGLHIDEIVGFHKRRGEELKQVD